MIVMLEGTWENRLQKRQIDIFLRARVMLDKDTLGMI